MTFKRVQHNGCMLDLVIFSEFFCRGLNMIKGYWVVIMDIIAILVRLYWSIIVVAMRQLSAITSKLDKLPSSFGSIDLMNKWEFAMSFHSVSPSPDNCGGKQMPDMIEIRAAHSAFWESNLRAIDGGDMRQQAHSAFSFTDTGLSCVVRLSALNGGWWMAKWQICQMVKASREMEGFQPSLIIAVYNFAEWWHNLSKFVFFRVAELPQI